MRMNTKIFLSAFILSVFLWIAKGIASSVLEEVGKGTESEAHTVSLKDVKEDEPPGQTELIFSVTDKKTGSSRTMSIHGRIAAIQDIMVVEKTKLVVVGQLKYGGSTFLISDLVKNELQDTIWAYSYAFSPSKRFLVYQTHYPRFMLPVEGRHSILLVYDLAKSASDNRVVLAENPARENLRSEPGSPYATGYIPDYAPGFPIFPETNVIKKSYVVTFEEEHLYLSPFLWSDEEEHLAFVEFYKEQNYLIHVDLSKGIINPVVSRQRIDIDSLIRKEVMSEGQKEELKKSPYKLAVEEIHWKGKDRVVLRPYRQYWLDETIELSVPQMPRR